MKNPNPKKKTRPPSRLYSIPPSCAARLFQDMAAIVNNPQDSDVQFRVKGGSISTLQENDETTCDEPGTVIIYAHSLILRCRSQYFATILDEEKNWSDGSNCVIYKPNISPSTLQTVLYYIYTGSARIRHFQSIIELIAVADEMDLEELGIKCQAELLRKVENILFDEYDSDEEDECGDISEKPIKQRTPIDTAVRKNIIPALNLARSLSLPHLSQKLRAITILYMPAIIESPGAYATFVDKISFEDFAKIVESDDFDMEECSIWDITLDWACHQIRLSKTLVEEHLIKHEDDEEDDDDEDEEEEESSSGIKISSSQFNQLKAMLAPLSSAIRFSLFKPDDYARMVYTINYFLPRRRSLQLQHYFIKTNHTRQLDAPRIYYTQQEISSSIINSIAWEILRKNILKTGGIVGCASPKHLKFELLFRASEHGFLAKTFHQRCDNKGPSLVLVRSSDGHLFGGVNFNHWKSDDTWTSSPLNILFILPHGHRNNSVVFRISQTNAHSSGNFATYGPVFGHYDLYIVNSANINLSRSHYSSSFNSFNGKGVSSTTLAGVEYSTLLIMKSLLFENNGS